MSLLEKLQSFPSSRRKKQRLGRGRGSGRGGTSTKGHKGQKARSGCRLANGFEGGQMTLARRLPKFGFTNRQFKVRYDIVNISALSRDSLSKEKTLDPHVLYRAGLVKKGVRVKILGSGTLKQSFNVSAHRFSRTAKEAIEKAGGTVTQLKYQPLLSAKKTKPKAEANQNV